MKTIYTAEQLKSVYGEPKNFTPINQESQLPKKTVAEKILDFTGGKEIAQGLGQAIAMKGSKKILDESLTNATTQQAELLARRKSQIEQGIDTTGTDRAIAINTQNLQSIAQGADELLNPEQLTGKEVVGDALQLATTAGGAKVAGAIAGKATQATGVVKGLVQGAKTGALSGTALGASTGVSQGLQDNLSAEEIAKKGVTGAITGGITGGILGGTVGAVSGGVKASKLAKESKYLDAITPNPKDLTPTEYENLLSRGKITPKVGNKPAQYVLSDEEKLVASKYKNLFTKDPVKNTQNILGEISKKDAEVGTFLKKNNGIFNDGELKNSIMKKLEGVDDLLVSDEKLTKAKMSITDNFMKSLKKNDMESLWKARKAFDKQIEKAFSGSPTLQNTMKKEFRNAVQDFIAERTPDTVYKGYMKDMSQLFDLKDVVNTKAVKEKGMNAIQIWIKRNPTKAKAIGWTAGTGVAGTLLTTALRN